MIFSGFSFDKLFGGLNIFKGEKLGKLIYLLLVISLCLLIFYKLFIMPTQNTHQEAEQITNNTIVEQPFFIGFKIGRLGLGVNF